MKLVMKFWPIILIVHLPFSFQLECYTCLSRKSMDFMRSSRERLPNLCPDEVEDWPTKVCKGGEVCYAVEFTIKDVRYIVRGCNGTRLCGFHCKNKKELSQKLNQFSHIYCFVCDQDLCNSAGKVISSLMGLIFLLAVQVIY